MLESYNKLQQKPKPFLYFKKQLQLIWSALLQKAYRKRLQACVSANGGHFEHLM